MFSRALICAALLAVVVTAAPSCTRSGTTETCTFADGTFRSQACTRLMLAAASSGTFTVPVYVTLISVSVAGGPGGPSTIFDQPPAPRGPAQIVTASLPVLPGDELEIFVGSRGVASSGSSGGAGGTVAAGSPCGPGAACALEANTLTGRRRRRECRERQRRLRRLRLGGWRILFSDRVERRHEARDRGRGRRLGVCFATVCVVCCFTSCSHCAQIPTGRIRGAMPSQQA